MKRLGSHRDLVSISSKMGIISWVLLIWLLLLQNFEFSQCEMISEGDTSFNYEDDPTIPILYDCCSSDNHVATHLKPSKRSAYGIYRLATKRPHKTAAEIQHLPPQDSFISMRGRKRSFPSYHASLFDQIRDFDEKPSTAPSAQPLFGRYHRHFNNEDTSRVNYLFL